MKILNFILMNHLHYINPSWYALYSMISILAFFGWSAARKFKTGYHQRKTEMMVTHDCRIIPKPQNRLHYPCVHHTAKIIDPEKDFRTYLEFLGDRNERSKKQHSPTMIIYYL